MKAIILARVSTEEQKEAGNSLEAQLHRMRSYCARKEFLIAQEFSFDESAYTQKRDELDKIIALVQESKEKLAVCFDKVDRLSRNVFDKRVSLLYEWAVADKIELHFVSDGLLINSSISAQQKFHFGIGLGLAKYYSDAISDNVKRAYEKMRRDGVYPSKPPLGYIRTKDDDDNKSIVLDPERAHIIAALFELYATGNYSLETLRQEAIKMGLRSVSGKIPPRSAIENILKDTFYYGIVQSKHNKYPPYPHRYECLITKDLFDACHSVREGKRTNRPKFLSKDFVFKGLLTCKNCGCLMTPEMKVKPSGKVFIYYSCTNAKGICKRVYVPEKTLLERVYSVFDGFGKITEEDQEYLVDELRKATEAEKGFHKSQIARLRKEYDILEQRDARLLDTLLDASITKDVYDKKHQELHDKIQLLKIELEEHEQGNYDYKTTVATVFSLARRAQEIFESSEPSEKRQFLNYLLQNPTVSEKKLEFSIRSPFNLVLELADCPSGGAYWESNPD